jgi:outer membrane protein assembly factor BamB
MSNDERRISDWLDHELDRLAIEGDRPGGAEADAASAYASESERALSDTIHRLRRLDAAHAGEPDPAFLQDLERQLMPTNRISQPWSGPPLRSARQQTLPAGTRFRGEPLGRGGSSRLSAFATLALVIAIVAATLVVTTWDRNGGAPEPSTGGYAAFGNDATPPGRPATPADMAGITWAVPFPDGTREAQTGQMVVENGLVYRQIAVDTGNEATGFSGIQAFRSADGEIAWERPMIWTRSGFAADATGLYTVASPNQIIALTPESGDMIWEITIPGSVASMGLDDGTLYVWDSTNTMTAIETTTGETVWSAPSGVEAPFQLTDVGAPLFSSSIVVGQSIVGAIAADGTLVTYDRGSGETTWTVPGFNAINSFTAVTDEMAFVLTTPDTAEGASYEPYPDREGVGIDLASGEVLWIITVSGEISMPVAPGGTGMFHLVADQVTVNESPAEASTPQINVEAGGSNGLWPESTPANVYGEQGPDGSDFVYGIDAQTGQIVWQRSSNGSGFAALFTSNSSSENLWALTYDNAVIRLGGEAGIILAPPVTSIPDPIIRLVAGSLEEGIVAETRGGTIYGFGHLPPEEQG